jgi:hypothetical protein
MKGYKKKERKERKKQRMIEKETKNDRERNKE